MITKNYYSMAEEVVTAYMFNGNFAGDKPLPKRQIMTKISSIAHRTNTHAKINK